MKKTSIKKLLSVMLSLVLFTAVIASLSITASADDSPLNKAPQDFGDAFYATIVLPFEGKALTNDGNYNVWADTTTGDDSQLWKFEKVGEAYKITSKLDGRCLTAETEAEGDIANIMVVDEGEGHECQTFYFYEYCLKYLARPNHSENQVIDVNAVNFNAQLCDFVATNPNQQFEITVKEVIEDVSEETSEAASEATSEESATESVAESTDATSEESAAESTVESTVESAAESTEESKTESKAEESKADDKDEDKGSIVPFVVIGVVAVIVIAAVVVVLKKKNSK